MFSYISIFFHLLFLCLQWMSPYFLKWFFKQRSSNRPTWELVRNSNSQPYSKWTELDNYWIEVGSSYLWCHKHYRGTNAGWSLRRCFRDNLLLQPALFTPQKKPPMTLPLPTGSGVSCLLPYHVPVMACIIILSVLVNLLFSHFRL